MPLKKYILTFILAVTAVLNGFSQEEEEIKRTSAINALDTIVRKPVSRDDINNEKYRASQSSRQKTDRFYDSLQSKTQRRKFSRFLYNSLIVPVKADDGSGGKYVDEARQYKQFEGKTIGEITIDRKPVFERGRSWLQKTANKTHILTREQTIKRELFFKSGQVFDPEVIVNNSQLLRSRRYIYDITFEFTVNEADTNVVNINLITRDSWTIGIGGEMLREKRVMAEIYDYNFLGTGDKLGVKTYFTRKFDRYGGNVLEYYMPNVMGTFYTAHLNVGKDFDKKLLEIDLRKEFILPTDYEAGISFSTYDDNRYKMYLIDTLHYGKVQYTLMDVWGGKSLFIPAINSSAYMTGLYGFGRFKDRPEISATLNPAFQDYDRMLVGVGLYREKFYTANMIYGYGFKEYLAAGYKVEGIAGYSWGEIFNDYYMGLNLSKGGFAPFGYLMGAASVGSYYNSGLNSWRRSAVDAEMKWISNLLNTRRTRIRQFINLRYTYGWNRLQGVDELLTFTLLRGPRSFNDYAVGDNRAVLNTETVIFTPFEPLGFRIALFGFADFSLLGTNKNIFNNPFYSTIGLGFRLRNERLVFNTIQFRFSVAIGKHGFNRNDMFVVSQEQRVSEYRFIPGKPELVGN